VPWQKEKTYWALMSSLSNCANGPKAAESIGKRMYAYLQMLSTYDYEGEHCANGPKAAESIGKRMYAYL